MQERVEQLIDGYDSGRLGRDEVIEQLALLAGGRSGESRAESTFRTTGLNHVALSVSDVDGMAEFMGAHLGTSVIYSTGSVAFLASGANHFVGLFRSDPVGLNHVCFTVDGYEPDDAAARVERAGMEPHRVANRVFFRGPDGILFQVADAWGDYPERP